MMLIFFGFVWEGGIIHTFFDEHVLLDVNKIKMARTPGKKQKQNPVGNKNLE